MKLTKTQYTTVLFAVVLLLLIVAIYVLTNYNSIIY